jgi:hypothetical protein
VDLRLLEFLLMLALNSTNFGCDLEFRFSKDIRQPARCAQKRDLDEHVDQAARPCSLLAGVQVVERVLQIAGF